MLYEIVWIEKIRHLSVFKKEKYYYCDFHNSAEICIEVKIFKNFVHIHTHTTHCPSVSV